MDMVRECMKGDRPFGVCRIVSGSETGAAAEHESIGCLARIVQWDMPQLGLLHVTAVGSQRFRVKARRVEPNALVRAANTPVDAFEHAFTHFRMQALIHRIDLAGPVVAAADRAAPLIYLPLADRAAIEAAPLASPIRTLLLAEAESLGVGAADNHAGR